jgi:hypothetical protein
MKTECIAVVCERFKPAFRGFGKTNMTMCMFFLNLYKCMETEEERGRFREIMEIIYGEDYDSRDRLS